MATCRLQGWRWVHALGHAASRLTCTSCLVLMSVAGAAAGEVHFELQLRGEVLRLTLRGQETVFFPRMYVLDEAGLWWPVPGLGDQTQAQPDLTLDLALPTDLRQRAHGASAVRISFKDKAGFTFVQFGTLRAWPAPDRPPAVHWQQGALWVGAPEDPVTTTWVLRAEQTGLVPVAPGNDENPAPAVKLQWTAGDRSPRPVPLSQGAGPWFLIHETASAEGPVFRVQPVLDLSNTPNQRPAWLDAPQAWAAAALCALAMSLWLSLPGPRQKGPGGPEQRPANER